jgi:Asp-tRNA(Asn)/Glu-tRNA(Gln) amidotransferase A subunit family amidase
VSGLPVGIQVVGHFGLDAELAEVAATLEQAWARSLAATE